MPYFLWPKIFVLVQPTTDLPFLLKKINIKYYSYGLYLVPKPLWRCRPGCSVLIVSPPDSDKRSSAPLPLNRLACIMPAITNIPGGLLQHEMGRNQIGFLCPPGPAGWRYTKAGHSQPTIGKEERG